MGRAGDGGKWICDPYRVWRKQYALGADGKLHRPPLVYSVGSNNDWGFEESILADGTCPYCEIHTFDHTMDPSDKKPSAVTFHKVGLSPKPSADSLLKPLPQIVKELQHDNRRIEIFKIDCEGRRIFSRSSCQLWCALNFCPRRACCTLNADPCF